MNQYANQVWLGTVLTFLVVTCLTGLHEVARELENPFRNAPNDIPLCTMMATYNEALVTMYSGFHPDSYWDEAGVFKVKGGLVNDVPHLSDDNTPRSMDDYDEKKDDALPDSRMNLPQSLDEDSLAALREMIESQAVKIKELQNRMQSRDPNMSFEVST
jgi:hypothetical protein